MEKKQRVEVHFIISHVCFPTVALMCRTRHPRFPRLATSSALPDGSGRDWSSQGHAGSWELGASPQHNLYSHSDNSRCCNVLHKMSERQTRRRVAVTDWLFPRKKNVLPNASPLCFLPVSFTCYTAVLLWWEASHSLLCNSRVVLHCFVVSFVYNRTARRLRVEV